MCCIHKYARPRQLPQPRPLLRQLRWVYPATGGMPSSSSIPLSSKVAASRPFSPTGLLQPTYTANTSFGPDAQSTKQSLISEWLKKHILPKYQLGLAKVSMYKSISNGPTHFGHDLCPFASGTDTNDGHMPVCACTFPSGKAHFLTQRTSHAH
jgi:hypothetical protein